MAGGRKDAEVVREYGPFEGASMVAGVTFDGNQVWFGTDDGVRALDPASGCETKKLAVRATAGTAFDGQHLYQVTTGAIAKIDPTSGDVIATIPIGPADQAMETGHHPAGLTWAEGTLWLAFHEEGKIRQLDPATGKILRTLDVAKFVTGISFVDGDLWHGVWDKEPELRRVNPENGDVLDILAIPGGMTGLEFDGKDTFYCGGGKDGKVRAVRRPVAAKKGK
jgi:outer membrane protein assembly factor BamB